MTKKRKREEKEKTTKNNIVPFWNNKSDKITKQLFKSDNNADLVQNSELENNWFTVLETSTKEAIEHKIQIPQQEVTSIQAIEEDNKDVKISSNRCTKIKVYPNEQQRKTLVDWFGTVRWTYNTLLKAFKDNKIKLNKKDMRAYCLNTDCVLLQQDYEKYKWILDTPYDVRDTAVIDLEQAYKTNFAKKKKDPNFTFEVKFRSKKKSRSEALNILKANYKFQGVFHPTAFGRNPLKSSEPLPDTLQYDSKLVRNYLGKYYMCLPQQPHQLTPAENRKKVISIDPGVRTFATTYDPGGRISKWGHQDIGRIQRLCFHADRLQSSIAKTKCETARKTSSKRWHKRRAFRTINERIRNLIRDFHCKFAKWLCSNYETILLPPFNSQAMVKRGTRKITSDSARQMLTWSHYQFQQRLIHKSSMYTGCQVLLVDEAYTSKTCGGCGHIHGKLGGSKLFRCVSPSSCGYSCDRDINGARNILLKYLTETKQEHHHQQSVPVSTVELVL